jgi:hypothetical protein
MISRISEFYTEPTMVKMITIVNTYTSDSLVGAGNNGEKIASANDNDVALWIFSNRTSNWGRAWN